MTVLPAAGSRELKTLIDRPRDDSHRTKALSDRTKANATPSISLYERDEGEARRAVARLGETVERVLKETGMSEEELAGLLDLRRALPE
jgi:hypothetical protein